jgi:hypothetical protein
MEDGHFNEIYLKNLRLWQLKLACGMAWHTEQLKSSLKVPLDTAHLILVQDTPLSIRFRFDEKRFDVDGAYDVRHEIIKSRLDKAFVKGGGERLTQPGKIAIVYSHPEEAKEMRHHIEFLQSEGYLTARRPDRWPVRTCKHPRSQNGFGSAPVRGNVCSILQSFLE